MLSTTDLLDAEDDLCGFFNLHKKTVFDIGSVATFTSNPGVDPYKPDESFFQIS